MEEAGTAWGLLGLGGRPVFTCRIGAMERGPFNLSNTILYCQRWRETVEFYRGVLGLPVTVEKDWFVEFRLTADSFVSVADSRRATVESSGGSGITLTLQVDDIHARHGRLVQAGIDAGEVRKHSWGAWSFFCRDPEGYRLEFWQPIEI